MYPDLLVATTGQGDDAAAFAVACALARAGGGHVAVLVQERVGVPPDAGLGFFAASAYVEFAEQVRRSVVPTRQQSSIRARVGALGPMLRCRLRIPRKRRHWPRR